MELPNVNTVSFQEEIPTDGHSPMKFLCDDGNAYYCKHRIGLKRDEIQCLLYEVLCSKLLHALQVPTPDIALVTITADSLRGQKLRKNKEVREGTVCFGSKEVQQAYLLSNLQKVQSKKDFNQYLNPEDVIRIAVFDAWVENADRGKENTYKDVRSNNYNLLLNPLGKKQQLMAFDHAFTFGAYQIMSVMPKFRPSIVFGILYTDFFLAVRRYLKAGKMLEILEISYF